MGMVAKTALGVKRSLGRLPRFYVQGKISAAYFFIAGMERVGVGSDIYCRIPFVKVILFYGIKVPRSRKPKV
jgi:hypothetical protein